MDGAAFGLPALFSVVSLASVLGFSLGLFSKQGAPKAPSGLTWHSKAHERMDGRRLDEDFQVALKDERPKVQHPGVRACAHIHFQQEADLVRQFCKSNIQGGSSHHPFHYIPQS